MAEGAIALAAEAPRGAVHLDFDPDATAEPPPAAGDRHAPDDASVERARLLLRAAQRPVVIAGIGAIEGATAVRAAIERLGCPVLTTYQATGLLPEGHPQLAGHYTSGAIEAALLERADLVLALGLDTVEPMPAPWRYAAPVVAVSQGPAASSFLPAEVELWASVAALAEQIIDVPASGWEPGAGRAVLDGARRELSATTAGTFGPVELATTVARHAPTGVVATVDAGAHFLAIMPFWPATHPLGLLISNGLATMGFALPAAIGAALGTAPSGRVHGRRRRAGDDALRARDRRPAAPPDHGGGVRRRRVEPDRGQAEAPGRAASER